MSYLTEWNTHVIRLTDGERTQSAKKVQTRAKSEQWTLSLRYVNGMWMQDEGFIGATRELSFYWVSSLARKHKKYVHVCIIISLKIILSDWKITDTERWEQGERIMNEQWGLCTWWARTKQNGERSVNARERTVSTKWTHGQKGR